MILVSLIKNHCRNCSCSSVLSIAENIFSSCCPPWHHFTDLLTLLTLNFAIWKCTYNCSCSTRRSLFTFQTCSTLTIHKKNTNTVNNSYSMKHCLPTVLQLCIVKNVLYIVHTANSAAWECKIKWVEVCFTVEPGMPRLPLNPRRPPGPLFPGIPMGPRSP